MESSYEDLRDQSLAYLRKCMDSLPPKKGLLLAYWIRDYTRFLNKEASFDPKKLIRYKRGSIVKAHLGFRVGSEEGGLHYAVVMDTCSTMYPSDTLSNIRLCDATMDRLDQKVRELFTKVSESCPEPGNNS